MAISDKLVDKRIVERNLERGTLDSAEYQRYLDGLIDMNDRVEPLLVKPSGDRAALEQAEEQVEDEPAAFEGSAPDGSLDS